MITIDNFTAEVKKYNKVKYLNGIIQRVNRGEGYCYLIGNHVVFNEYLTGWKKEIMDKFRENSRRGIVSFDL